MSYVVDFDPGLCGPFDTEDEAVDWARRMIGEYGERGVTHSHTVVKLSPPDTVPNAVLPYEERRR